jgi:glycosyltransferase involved in cell wall biosynthesis
MSSLYAIGREKTMRIAFINQPIDSILPPKQSSVGACTYGMSRALVPMAEVVVYGLENLNGKSPVENDGVEFRFIPATRLDILLFNLQKRLAKIIPRSSPISTSRWMFPGYGRRVAMDLSRQHFDVIHLQHCSQYIDVIRAHNPEAKIVLHLHGEWFSQSDPRVLEDRLEQLDLLTTVSNHITEKTKRTFPTIAPLCETTYNGIDAQEFAEEPDYEARREQTPKRILYAGAVSPHKGLHVLLDAFGLVSPLFPDAVLDIVGPLGSYPIEENFDLEDQETIATITRFYPAGLWTAIRSKLLGSSMEGEYLSYLKASLPRSVASKVAFIGMISRSELVARYYGADIFVFPPIWDEGFGLPPLEAMAAGVPVVASRSGAVVETVVDNQTGFLVEKNNAEELAQTMLELLRNPERRESMGRAGRKRALELFTWDHVSKDVHRRYEVLSEHAMHAVSS